MTKAGARADALNALLGAAGWASTPPPPRPRICDLTPDGLSRIRQIYDDLAGIPEQFEHARPGSFDLAFDTGDGKLIVELDEEQHFNRYRTITLSRPWAAQLPWTTTYVAYSAAHEAQLVRRWRSGRRWTNESAPRFFGVASPPGDFSGAGAPRWRQRAFYDAVKDLMPAIRLARVSVHDELEGRALNVILRSGDLTTAALVRAHVEARAHTWPSG